MAPSTNPWNSQFMPDTTQQGSGAEVVRYNVTMRNGFTELHESVPTLNPPEDQIIPTLQNFKNTSQARVLYASSVSFDG